MGTIKYKEQMSLNDSTAQVYEALPQPAQPVIVINNHVAPSGSAPVLPDNKVELENVNKWAHRLRITSWVALTIGVTSTLSMIHWFFTSRHITEAMLAYEEDPKAWMMGQSKPVDPNAPVSHAYFALYDILKTWCFYGALFSMSLAGLGCKSLKASRVEKHNSQFTHRVMKCGAFKVVFMLFMGMAMSHSSKELKAVVDSLKKKESVHHPLARQLSQWRHHAADQVEEPVEEPVVPEEAPKEEAPKAKIMPDFGYGKEHHHKRHGCHMMSLIFAGIIGTHFYFLAKLKKAQKDAEEKVGQIVQSNDMRC